MRFKRVYKAAAAAPPQPGFCLAACGGSADACLASSLGRECDAAPQWPDDRRVGGRLHPDGGGGATMGSSSWPSNAKDEMTTLNPSWRGPPVADGEWAEVAPAPFWDPASDKLDRSACSLEDPRPAADAAAAATTPGAPPPLQQGSPPPPEAAGPSWAAPRCCVCLEEDPTWPADTLSSVQLRSMRLDDAFRPAKTAAALRRWAAGWELSVEQAEAAQQAAAQAAQAQAADEKS